MQRVIADHRQFSRLLSDLKSEGYKVNGSQEEFQIPGIFFVHKNGSKAHIERLKDENIYYLQRAYDDCWK